MRHWLIFRSFVQLIGLLAVHFFMASVHAQAIGKGDVDLVPILSIKVDKLIPMTVRVVDVVGSDKDFKLVPVSNKFSDRIRSAIVRSFEGAGVFRGIGTDGETDLDLKTIVVSSAIVKSEDVLSTEFRQDMTIRYEFIDRGTGKLVWRETYVGEGGATGMGSAHFLEARDLAVKETIRLLVEGVNERWTFVRQ